ncbi:protein of unknown function [Shewanella benthica]|uniref:Uncharacterized protein n=1 Tax=Shewanella benthica TaxID=43661 RepID=A0A330M2C7_9GAMM|nr:protein of unknown function [Shewanella benthica]
MGLCILKHVFLLTVQKASDYLFWDERGKHTH